MSDFFRRAAERAHSYDDAKNGGDNAQARQGIGYRAEGRGGRGGILMVNLEVEVEHLVEVEGVDAGDGHAQRVTNEIANMMVLEEGGILGKYRALGGFFHVRFEGHQPVFTGLIEQVVQHFQSVNVSLLAELGAAEDAPDAAPDLLEDVEWISDQKSTDGRAADCDQFRRLNQDAKVAVLHEVASHDATEDHDDADNGKHFL